MPITVPARSGSRARRTALASVLAVAALTLAACRDDGTGIRPAPAYSGPSNPSGSAESPHTSSSRTPAPPSAPATEPYRP
ncbi:hypothetical protein [Streptomyces niger]|uniref:hypothetical protein n=1 Tax=Streptomyces niger TaxID=66373 RepID=UPI0018FE0E8E|nr:hypothetical protein [Streptomyces niger]